MSRACSICLDRDINTTFFPCQHQTCCSICVSKLDSLCCPVCRKSVSYVLLGCEQTSAESLSSKVSDENAGLTRKDKLSKWCLSCIVRYRQEIESYLSEKVYSVLFAGYTSHLKQLMNRFSAIVYEKVPYSEYSSNEKPQCGFSPSEIVSRVSKKLQGCPNGCLERAAIYDQEWGFSLLCAENEAEHLINGCPCRFGHCQLWELVRRLQSGERLPQLLILCFSSTLTSSFQQVVDMHNLIYRYKENYESVGLPGILWVMLDIKTKNIQSANTEVVSDRKSVV